MTARAITPLSSKTTSAAPRGRIVILSSDSAEAGAVRITLEGAGFQVAGICSSVRCAVDTVREMRPDLVLAALFFDGEPHGIELSRKIQEELRVPVIYLGAADDPMLVLQISMTQPAGLISDPRDKEYLQAVVGRALKGARPVMSSNPY